jgi:hypothetical protein
MQIKFPISEIRSWAGEYLKNSPAHNLVREARIETMTALEVHERGFYTKPELVELVYWKTPRAKARVERNAEGFVNEVTRTALSTPDERLRIEVLTLLQGVNWPTASVLLHFGHKQPYPILDIQALWSLGVETASAYTFEFWWEYTQTCRKLAQEAGVSMRILDRALTQYSKEKQKG